MASSRFIDNYTINYLFNVSARPSIIKTESLGSRAGSIATGET
ncbi:hypothetical protein LKI01_03490 [Companilactobacillus paralimentarius]|nr:hypothetical protein LKI01_03490 [Companilactobacillus paralimentarius]